MKDPIDWPDWMNILMIIIFVFLLIEACWVFVAPFIK